MPIFAPHFVRMGFQLKEDDILFLDNHLLVVRKPAGVLVQPDENGSPNLEDAAKDWIRARFGKEGNVFATATHRLDRPVGGLVIIARTSKALARMNQMFAERHIKKVYLAIVEGKPEMEKHLRHWIKKNEQTNKVWTYTYERGDARQADLKYWHAASMKERALVCVRLFTGRHHQIRAQLALDGIAITGDSKYGKRSADTDQPALYSYAVQFVHPVTRQDTIIKAPLPKAGIWQNFPDLSADILDKALSASLNQDSANN